MKTTPKTLHIPSLEPRGVFIATREEGGQGTGPGPKRGRGHGRTAAKTRPGPRFRGHTAEAPAAFWARACPLAPLFPGAYKNPPGFFSLGICRV